MMRAATGLSLLLALAGPAGARRLPRVEPAPKVQTCPEMGEGYVRIDGSDTCVKMSGSVRIESSTIRTGTVLSPDGSR